MIERSSNHRRFWNSKEAASYLQVTPQTLFFYCHKPKNGRAPPPFRRFGRNCLRFPIEEFIKWAETWDQPGEKKDV